MVLSPLLREAIVLASADKICCLNVFSFMPTLGISPSSSIGTPPPLESLSDSSIYLLRAKLNRGERMSREDKDWLREAANNNTYFHSAVPLQGWRFDFYYYDLLFLTSRMPFL